MKQGDAVIDGVSVNVDDPDTGCLDVYAYTEANEDVRENPKQNATDAEVLAAMHRVAAEVRRRNAAGGGHGLLPGDGPFRLPFPASDPGVVGVDFVVSEVTERGFKLSSR